MIINYLYIEPTLPGLIDLLISDIPRLRLYCPGPGVYSAVEVDFFNLNSFPILAMNPNWNSKLFL